MKKLLLSVGMSSFVFFIISLSCFSIAYEPRKDATLKMVSDLSDAFLMGTVNEILHGTKENRQTVTNKIEVKQILYDRTNRIYIGEVIDVVTDEIFFPKDNKQIKKHNIPEFETNSNYLIFLRWNSLTQALSPTTGTSSVFEIDDANNILNLDGVYIKDVINDKIVFGSRKKQKIEDIKKEEPPIPSVTDLYGRKTIGSSLKRSQDPREIESEKKLDMQQFLEKVLKRTK